MKVISFNQLPTRLPVGWSCLIYLMMDKFQAGALAWGIVGTLMAIVWIVSITVICKEERVKLNL